MVAICTMYLFIDLMNLFDIHSMQECLLLPNKSPARALTSLVKVYWEPSLQALVLGSVILCAFYTH